MVINKDTTLSIYPDWVVTGYTNAQNTVATNMSGQDLIDASQRQDDVIWTYWNNHHKTYRKHHKTHTENQWREDWFYSDLSSAISKETNPAKLKGLQILQQAIKDAQAGNIKNQDLGIITPPPDNTSNVVQGVKITSMQMSGGGTPLNTGIINSKSVAAAQAAQNKEKLALAKPNNNAYLYIGVSVFVVASVSAILIWRHFHQTEK